MYNDRFHIFHFAKNYTPFHILMLVVHDEMDICLPIKLHIHYNVLSVQFKQKL